MPKLSNFHPQEATLDEVPFNQRDAIVRDTKKVALIAAGSIDNRDELCDVLEMIGLKVNRPE